MCDIIIYVAWWWEKFLSRRNLFKHTCSWRVKLIVLWTLNRQAKMFLHSSGILSHEIPTYTVTNAINCNWRSAFFVAYKWMLTFSKIEKKFISQQTCKWFIITINPIITGFIFSFSIKPNIFWLHRGHHPSPQPPPAPTPHPTVLTTKPKHLLLLSWH